MRVISGTARGRRLRAAKGLRMRPTSDRVKEAIFDILGWDWAGRRVLDLFAGSGALGIEALSRGCDRALFVEADPRCVSVILENLAACGLSGRATVMRSDVFRFLARSRGNYRFHAIFADPPYQRGLANRCLLELGRGGWLEPGGLLLVEHSSRESVIERARGLTRLDGRAYGETGVSIYGAEERQNTG